LILLDRLNPRLFKSAHFISKVVSGRTEDTVKNIMAVALALTLLATAVFAKDERRMVPITTSPEGLLFISGSLGLGIDAHFVLDTGGGLNVLAPSLVEKLKSKPTGRFTVFRMTGERIDLVLYTIPELRVGPVVEKPATVAVWDLLDKYHLDGIISANFFRKQPFTIDFSRKLLLLEDKSSLPARRQSGHVLQLKLDDERGISLDLFAQFLLDSHKAECEIDTGSQGVTFDTRYLDLLGIDKDSKSVKKSEKQNSVGSKLEQYETSVPALALAGVPASDVLQSRATFQDIIYDCVIGTEFWSGKVVTFDLPEKVLIVGTSQPHR
jgi:hypothetical protein